MSDIKVFCRIRPLNQKETDIADYKIENQTIGMQEQKYTFDQIFNTNAQQQDVYEVVGRPIIEQLLQGFNATLLMYGQTASGKTHTMIGDKEQPGLLSRTISELFEAIGDSPQEVEFRIKVSLYEIYKEKVRDLLDVRNCDLKVREMAGQGFHVQSITQLWISEEDEVHQALQRSIQNRQVGHTNMNDMSSRSHLIFQLTLIMNNESEGTSYTGQLIMADLAGSENASRAGTTGVSLQEGSFINKSLLTLSNVINALSEKQQHIPYRESNLSKVLWNGLSKNSLTSLVITCSPSASNESETISTLRFGTRAKMIKTEPKVNKEVTVKEMELLTSRLQKQLDEKIIIIEQLKNQGSSEQKILQLEEQNIKLKQENEDKQIEITAYQGELEMKSSDILEMIDERNSLQQQLLEQEQEISTYKSTITKLNQTVEQLHHQLQESEVQSAQSQLPANDISLIDISALPEESELLKKQLIAEKLKLKQQNKVYESQIQILHKQNKVYEDQIRLYSQQIEQLTQQNYRLQGDLENRVKKVVELEEKVDQIKELFRTMKQSLNSKDHGLLEENDKLRNQLEQVNRQYMLAINSTISIDSQSKVVRQQMQAKVSRIQQLELENQQLRIDNSKFNSSIINFDSPLQEDTHRISQISKVIKKQSQQQQIELL